ncbi:MAG: class I SAM-dependent methyltransferase [Gammaproteobacteria bacterium]|nr:class I SAM-dependent methyltransferase [Gammaproteobacteria bacterium]
MRVQDWNNFCNAEFYAKLTSKEMEELANVAGLSDCHDLQLIIPHIINAQSVLEIGAGNGRVLKCLIKHGFRDISAIERDRKFCDILGKEFGKDVAIHCTDLHNFNTEKKFDAILWLWSGIVDFSRDEQYTILSRLSSLLTPGGVIAIDTVSQTPKPSKYYVYIKGKDYIIKIGDKIIFGYNPSRTDIKKYIEGSNTYIKCSKKYATISGRKRIFYILSKAL